MGLGLSLGLGLTAGRGSGVPSWLLSSATRRDIDLLNNRYWQGGLRPAVTDLLTTARSSTHLLADASGAYQSFGNNVLARNNGVGAYIGGQVTNIISSPNDLNAAAWTKQNGATVAADGDFWAVTDANAAAASQLVQTGTIPADTALRTFWIDLKKDTENTVIRRIYFRFTTPTIIDSNLLINTSTGAWRQTIGPLASVRDLGDRWRVVMPLTNGNDTVYECYLIPAFNTNINSNTQDNAAVGTASFSWPYLILGSYPSGQVWPFAGRTPFGGWSMAPQDNRVLFQPEIGPPITRRRGTAKTKKWAATYHLTSAEFGMFEDFFENEIQDGALSFTMPHPRTSVIKTFKFADSPYTVDEFGTNEVTININILEMP